MFLTRECDYAVRIIRVLAGAGRQTVKKISDEEQIPKQYAYKILKKLENAGFLQSRQGPAGGYELVKEPETFTLYDVIAAVDDGLLLSACVQEGYVCARNTPERPCSVHAELCRLSEMLKSGLREKTMAEVLLTKGTQSSFL